MQGSTIEARGGSGGMVEQARLSAAIARHLAASESGDGGGCRPDEVALTYLVWRWRAEGGADSLGDLDPVWVADHLLRLTPEEGGMDGPIVATFLRSARDAGLLPQRWDPVLDDARPAGRLLPAAG